jgi:hypothetical protein
MRVFAVTPMQRGPDYSGSFAVLLLNEAAKMKYSAKFLDDMIAQ